MEWPATDEELVELQERLAAEAGRAVAERPWTLPAEPPLVGACFVAFTKGESGPGHRGDPAWAAAVVWRSGRDLEATAVVADRVPAAYMPDLLARREGAILAAAVRRLAVMPHVLLVNATGIDHPRGAGLTVHLGWVTGIPTVGVTHRPLVAAGDLPLPVRASMSPILLDGRTVGYWVCTRTRTRPVVAHAGWRTEPETAAAVVLAASSKKARTPIPLRAARRLARESRAQA